MSDENNDKEMKRLLIHGWMIVCGIAIAYVLYGLFAFFVIGHQEPPDWDFGAMEDIPGESMYSTYPYRGQAEQPRPQHVSEKPPFAETDIADNPPPPGGNLQPVPGKGPLSGAGPQTERKGPSLQGSK
jgi:hypothetical protein